MDMFFLHRYRLLSVHHGLLRSHLDDGLHHLCKDSNCVGCLLGTAAFVQEVSRAIDLSQSQDICHTATWCQDTVDRMGSILPFLWDNHCELILPTCLSATEDQLRHTEPTLRLAVVCRRRHWWGDHLPRNRLQTALWQNRHDLGLDPFCRDLWLCSYLQWRSHRLVGLSHSCHVGMAVGSSLCLSSIAMGTDRDALGLELSWRIRFRLSGFRGVYPASHYHVTSRRSDMADRRFLWPRSFRHRYINRCGHLPILYAKAKAKTPQSNHSIK